MIEQDKHKATIEWCFRSETAKLLCLSVTQIHASLKDGNNSVDTLTDSFQQLANFCYQVNKLSTDKNNAENTAESILEITANMSEKINAAIVAFQFYDRLSQRMEHVATSLNRLSELVRDDAHLNDPNGWGQLRDGIKNSYSLDAEHLMYKAIMEGSTIEEALAIYNATVRESEASDDIELF